MVGTGPVRKAFQRVARQRGADSAWAEIETRIAEMTAELATLRAGDQPACLEALAEAKQAWEAAEAALKFAKDEAAEAWRRAETAEARADELVAERARAMGRLLQLGESASLLEAVQRVVDARDKAEARTGVLTRCLVKLSLRSSFPEWREDDPEGYARFDKIMHDGSESDEIDLDTVCEALGVQ